MKKEFKVGNKVIVECEVTATSENAIKLKYSNGVINDEWYCPEIVKHAEPEFIPREMLVWDSIDDPIKKMVLGVFENQFMTKNIHGQIVGYKNAKEVPKELENGKVYKHKHGSIIYKTAEKSGFGFRNEIFTTSETWDFNHDNWQEYHIEDFKKLLITEAEKRGFKSGVFFRTPSGTESVCKNTMMFNNNATILYFGDYCILKEGIWSEIIPTITKKEAELKLGAKIID